MTRESRTSWAVISPVPRNPRSVIALAASGLRTAWARVATEMAANWSWVVPYWCMWRCLTMA